jgi:hypothetical protein
VASLVKRRPIAVIHAALGAAARHDVSHQTHRFCRGAKKTAWGALTGRWVPHDTRDTVVDFVRDWSAKTELPGDRFITWIGIARGKFFAWRKRYGKANEHNALVPRDHWLTDDEKQVYWFGVNVTVRVEGYGM